jgi:hypothetical protein
LCLGAATIFESFSREINLYLGDSTKRLLAFLSCAPIVPYDSREMFSQAGGIEVLESDKY